MADPEIDLRWLTDYADNASKILNAELEPLKQEQQAGGRHCTRDAWVLALTEALAIVDPNRGLQDRATPAALAAIVKELEAELEQLSVIREALEGWSAQSKAGEDLRLSTDRAVSTAYDDMVSLYEAAQSELEDLECGH